MGIPQDLDAAIVRITALEKRVSDLEEAVRSIFTVLHPAPDATGPVVDPTVSSKQHSLIMKWLDKYGGRVSWPKN